MQRFIIIINRSTILLWNRQYSTISIILFMCRANNLTILTVGDRGSNRMKAESAY